MKHDTLESLLPKHGPGRYRLLRALLGPLVGRFLRALAYPDLAQRRALEQVGRGLRGTAFARDHGLRGGESLDAFRERVPVRTWEELTPYMDRVAAGERGVLTRAPVQSLLETSGTTGARKLIPVTGPWARTVAEAQQLWVLSLLLEHPGLAEGAALTMVSPAVKGHTSGGLPFGSNTGRMHLAQPWWVRARYPVPYPVYCIEEPTVRLYCILRFALQADIRSVTAANPTTLLLLARAMDRHSEHLAKDLACGTLEAGPAAALSPTLRAALAPRLRPCPAPRGWRPGQAWDLEVVNCWKGGSAGWFLPLLPDALGRVVPIREVGLSASESFLALALRDSWEGALAWPLGDLIELVGDDNRSHTLGRAEAGAEYRVVISGRHGLYRYDLGDRVRVEGHVGATPVLRFLRRDGNILSATGEKLTEDQVIQAMETTCRRHSLPPAHFTVSLRMDAVPSYIVAIEGDRLPDAADLDGAFCKANVEYGEKRAGGRLGPLSLLRLPHGTYGRVRLLAALRGGPDGQYKEPVMAMEQETWDGLLEAAEAVGPGSEPRTTAGNRPARRGGGRT